MICMVGLVGMAMALSNYWRNVDRNNKGHCSRNLMVNHYYRNRLLLLESSVVVEGSSRIMATNVHCIFIGRSKEGRIKR